MLFNDCGAPCRILGPKDLKLHWFYKVFSIDFWTFENDKVKYGGMLQWIQNTLPENWYAAHNDLHPSSEAHKKFTEKVLTTAIEIINN